jgi:energy-coupling factor transporter transmembrane protein EcfT
LIAGASGASGFYSKSLAKGPLTMSSKSSGEGCALLVGISIVACLAYFVYLLVLFALLFLCFLGRTLIIFGSFFSIFILPALVLGFISALILSQVCGRRFLKLESDPSGLNCSFDRDSRLFTTCNTLLLIGNFGLCLWASHHWSEWLNFLPFNPQSLFKINPLSFFDEGLFSSWLPALEPIAVVLAFILSLVSLAFILAKIQSASLAGFLARRGKQVQESCLPQSLRTRLAELADEAEAAAKDTPWSAPKL